VAAYREKKRCMRNRVTNLKWNDANKEKRKISSFNLSGKGGESAVRKGVKKGKSGASTKLGIRSSTRPKEKKSPVYCSEKKKSAGPNQGRKSNSAF